MTDEDVNRDSGSAGTSYSLLARAQNSDQEAWSTIVDLYGPMVYRWCRKAGLSDDAALDVGQDVMLRAWKNLGKFQPTCEHRSFRRWLSTITKHAVIDYIRRHQIKATGDPSVIDPPFPDPDESLPEDIQFFYNKIEEFIRTHFSEKHCDAFLRVKRDGEDPAEVAASLGMTRDAVYLAISRIKKRVDDEFRHLLP